MSNNGSRLAMFAIGATMAGTTALMLAPRSGAETRRRIRRNVGDTYDRGERRVRARARAVGHAVTDARRTCSKRLKRGLKG